MPFQINRVLIAAILYLTICLLTVAIIKPFSILNFIGPAAGLATALTLAWGISVFVSIVLGTIAFVFFLNYYITSSFEPAVIIIATLAIILQAYVARLLTLRVLPNQKWLNNRATLVRFMLIIGPGVALLSSAAAMLVSILDSEKFDTLPIYTFVMNFSGSVLVAIFVTPLLFFTQSRQKLELSKRLYISLVSVLICIAVTLLFKVSEQQHQYQRGESFNKHKNQILTELKQEISEISNQLRTVTALFKSSEFVSAQEFNSFSNNLFHQSLSIRALEWVPVVSLENKSIFEDIATDQLKKKYLMVERTAKGEVRKVAERPLYTPIYYVFPQGNDDSFGYDLFTHEAQRLVMNMAAKLTLPVATPPQEIVESDFYQPKMRVFYPLYSTDIKQSFGRYQTELNNDITGFVVAQVQFSQFFQQLSAESISNNIQLVVEDISVNNPFFVFGEYVSSMNRLSESVSIEFFSRHWQITFYEQEVWLLQDKSWQTWAVLLGGTFAALLFQLLFFMVAVYSNELTHRVNTKTKSLIAEKDKADKENLAKTEFLQTLSTELNTPFNVIKKLTETFPQKNLSDIGKEYVANISAAAFNLGRMIDSAGELSRIDSGQMTFSKQPFNFIEFMHRMESTLRVRRGDEKEKLSFAIPKDAPAFINSDELRLQQLFIALAENAEEILTCQGAVIAVKTHTHIGNKATIFFIITPTEEQLSHNDADEQHVLNTFDENLQQYNARVSMVEDLCVLFGGKLKLAQLPSGNMMISASIKVDIHQQVQQNEGSNFITHHKRAIAETKRLVLAHNSKISDGSLALKLRSLGYQLDLLEEGESINDLLNQQSYHAIVFDDSLSIGEMLILSQMMKNNRENNSVVIIAILSVELNADMIRQLKNYIDTFAFSSISQVALQQVLVKHIGN